MYVDAEYFNAIPEEFLSEPKPGLISDIEGFELTRQRLKQANVYLSEDNIGDGNRQQHYDIVNNLYRCRICLVGIRMRLTWCLSFD